MTVLKGSGFVAPACLGLHDLGWVMGVGTWDVRLLGMRTEP